MSLYDDAELDFYTITLPNMVGSWFGGWDQDDKQMKLKPRKQTRRMMRKETRRAKTH